MHPAPDPRMDSFGIRALGHERVRTRRARIRRRLVMPRVLLVSQPTDGGVFRHVCDLAQGLPAHGFDVALAAPPLSGPPPAATVVALPLVRAPSPVEDARAVAGLARAVRALRPDLVHAHSSKAGAVARLARLLAPRTPVVYTPHGYAHAGYFESRAQRRVYRSAERALTPLASRIVCVCEAERRLALDLGAGARARVVYNGIGPPVDTPVHPEVAAMRERGPVIATVTLLRPGKGIETLLDALPAVLSVHPGAQLAIAGNRRRPRAPRAPRRHARRGGGGPVPRLRPRDRGRPAGRRRLRLELMGRVVPLRGARGDGARTADRRDPGRRRRRGGARRRVRPARRAARRRDASRRRSPGSSPTRRAPPRSGPPPAPG